MKYLILAELIFAVSFQQPAPSAPTFDELVSKLKDQRKAAADQAKAIAALEQEIRDRFNTLQKQLADLGLVGPTPPDPAPPPKPVDPLVSKLKAAYAADKGTKDALTALVAVYSAGVDYAKNASVTSTKILQDDIRQTASDFVAKFGPDTLKSLRTVVAAELAAVIGTPSTDPITDAQRKAAADLFAKLVTILEGF